MSATYEQAVDEILGAFRAAWDATGYVALYENVAGDIPSGPDPWARPTVRHAPGLFSSLSDGLGRASYGRSGSVIVQVFTSFGTGLDRAMQLAKVVADAYEGVRTASGVWFRNVRIEEAGPDGQWYQVNVVADFAYDEVK